MRKLILVPTLLLVAAPAPAATYAECAVMGTHLRELHARELHLQGAIDIATSAKAEKRLRVKLRAIKRQERRLNAQMANECSPPDDYPAAS